MTGSLERALAASVGPGGLRWLAEACAEVGLRPATVRTRFPAVGRRVGRGPLPGGEAGGCLVAWTVEDAARAVLLEALGEALASELEGLYRHGDTGERRAVLRWIGLLPDATPHAVLVLPLVEDGLRSNDPRLVEAALGPWAVRSSSDDILYQGVLKCLFLGIPLGGMSELAGRAGPQLARMLVGYVHERVAAGRSVSPEVWPLIDRHPPERELAGLEAELDHPVSERREAARAAFAGRAVIGGPFRRW